MVREVIMSEMRDPASFEDPISLKSFLARQLHGGRLALVLGAGVSMGYGLPAWGELMDKAFVFAGRARPPRLSDEEAADVLLEAVGHDDLVFARMIRRALYDGFSLDFASLRSIDLLGSLGALAMASLRGSVTALVSFNFDDLLERYLQFHGFYLRSIPQLPAWSGRADATVYHPHAFLPSNGGDDEITAGIVLAQTHYDRVVGQNVNQWRMQLLQIFRSNTCLFIGLSGKDTNLRSILEDVKGSHARDSAAHAYWGVRISDDETDPLQGIWRDKGVYQETLGNYNELPEWLLDVCQRAAVIR